MSTSQRFAYNAFAEERQLEKARVLARWCYDRGIDDRILDVAPDRLRMIARQAPVTRPQEAGGSPTWQLLTQREAWDRAYGVTGPPRARCVECAIDGQPCGGCAPQLPLGPDEQLGS